MMRKLKLFFISAAVITVSIFIYSCVHDEGVASSNSVNPETSENNIQSSNSFSSSQLLIVPIPFYNNMFHFPSEESFEAVKDEISLKSEEYEEYFIWRNLNFSSFDIITNITEQVNDTMTETQVNQLLTQYQVTPNDENEVDYKFDMLWMNLLLNVDGLVSIDSNIVAFTGEDISYYSSLEHYNLFKIGKSNPLKVIKFNLENTFSRIPNHLCKKYCRTDFDQGNGCQDRRLRGQIVVYFRAWDGPPYTDCEVIYEVEAETAWFKRVAYIWWFHKANRLDVSVDWGIFNSRGATTNNCFKTGTNTNTNQKTVRVNSVISCISNFSPDRECHDHNIKDFHGLLRGNSSHSGIENGNCGGTRNCNTACL